MQIQLEATQSKSAYSLRPGPLPIKRRRPCFRAVFPTTIFSPSPVFNPKPLFSKPLYPSALAPKRTPHFSPCKATLTSNGKQLLPTLQLPQLNPKSWFSNLNHGLAAFALSMAISFCPGLPSDTALASEFDVINDGPPTESYVVDDAGVLSRVTKSDLKRLLSDLESRKNFRINFITVRKTHDDYSNTG